ncbi:4-alpha-glucanotransferase [Nevskia sp.]|uniref:4-alpha-glucanotransferase n=1 Tax=Nevskia sp. TaxID=1929292 RepID=UPI0025E8CC90|nr:4-alpha-glucanotransferase [Nevskia sp.]
MSALQELAAAAGLSTRWIDWQGVHREVRDDTLQAVLTALGYRADDMAACERELARLAAERAAAVLPPMLVVRAGAAAEVGQIADPALRAYVLTLEDGTMLEGTAEAGDDGICRIALFAPIGYHRLAINGQHLQLAIVPPRAFTVQDLAGERRLWGCTAQLYALRSKGDGGIGTFSGLGAHAKALGERGADALAVSPVHALFAADVERFSPYSPSSRLFVNALHVDLAEAFGTEALAAALVDEGTAALADELESLELVDWPRAARLRLKIARRLLAGFDQLSDALRADCAAFIEAGGAALLDHARFEALHGHFLGLAPPLWRWTDWPAEYRNPRSAEVEVFAAEQAAEVAFHLRLQWLADRGLRLAQAQAKAGGMAIGLISDLAVGADGGGSHGWSRPQDFLQGLSVGAPPDALNALGQGWGLTAYSPRALCDEAYAPFLELLRAQLRHAGGLRIDHVIGLGRLWLVPDGAGPREGAYLQYPIEALFGLIALESWRHRAVIIGEDMGTVPDGFRQRMSPAGILGMRVLWFERDWGFFVEPARWPADVVAMSTTHDLPTVAGWWTGRDIDWRAALALYGEGQDEAQDRAARVVDREKLWGAFVHAGLASGAMPPVDQPSAVVDAACAFVAATPSPLALIPLEDLFGVIEQPNVPGTIDEHPNWRRRLAGDVRTLSEAPEITARMVRIAARR